jgi:hypothetical protein
MGSASAAASLAESVCFPAGTETRYLRRHEERAVQGERLDQMRTGDGRPIPPRLKIEIEGEWKRLKVVVEQMRNAATD